MVVIGAVNADVTLDVLAEFLTDFLEELLAPFVAHGAVGKVGVHAGTVPVPFNGLGMKVDGDVVALCGTLEEVAGEPDLVAGVFGAPGKDLVFTGPS